MRAFAALIFEDGINEESGPSGLGSTAFESSQLKYFSRAIFLSLAVLLTRHTPAVLVRGEMRLRSMLRAALYFMKNSIPKSYLYGVLPHYFVLQPLQGHWNLITVGDGKAMLYMHVGSTSSDQLP